MKFVFILASNEGYIIKPVDTYIYTDDIGQCFNKRNENVNATN